MLEQARAAQIEALKRIIDPHDDNSPLGRYRAEIIKAVKQETAEVRKAVAEVSEKIAVRNAEADLLDRDLDQGHLVRGRRPPRCRGDPRARTVTSPSRPAARSASTATRPATRSSPSTPMTRPAPAGGSSSRSRTASSAWPALSTRSMPRSPTAARWRASRCSAARRTRRPALPSSTTALARSLRSTKTSSTTAPCASRCCGGGGPSGAELLDATDGVSVERIEALLDDACRALEKVATTRRCHSTAKKKIDEAIGHVNELAEEVEAALDALRDEIGRLRAGTATNPPPTDSG